MKTIVFASGKGGVGKTTLAFNVAVYAAKSGARIDLIDRDPTEALTRFGKMRGQEAPQKPLGLDEEDREPWLLNGVDSVAMAVRDLRKAPPEDRPDFLIVDTPNAMADVIRDALASADLIVMPVQPSPVDVLVNEQVVSMVKDELGLMDRVLFVVNGIDNRSDIGNETVGLLTPISHHKPIKITGLTDYKRALIEGKGAVEINGKAKAEIAALWKAIQEAIRKVEDEDAKHGRSAKPRSLGPAQRV